MAQAETKSTSSTAYNSIVPFTFGNISFPGFERNSSLQFSVWEKSRLAVSPFIDYVFTCDIYESGPFESGVLNMTSPDT